ncbi:hypothetical protein LTS07_001052 [Exophiala sideris]|uniref:GDP-mannose transporter n=1 Tax=Exophiala sideris TaxID=1016849 RepID=A0ABR0JSH5_9EURO|nr:hypothetical protein LTS07_001052 [Exophiala sideris]KAK5043022.1 hypothetical protein LTR13_000793 [Exophiala sideris]KAK5068932.1 hypothetical protein LTR69_001053 [Exophiala sideris]
MADQSPTRLYVSLAVGFHICTALAVTILNKAVLNTLPVPVMLLLCQSLMSITLIHLGSLLKIYTLPRLDYGFIRGVLPLLAMKIIAQLSKTYCLLSSRPSPFALAASAITTLGFVLGVSGEAVGQTSTVGIAWGVWSSLTTALESVLVKYLALKCGIIDLVYVTSLATVPVYATLAVINGELWQMAALGLTHPIMLRFEREVFVSGLFNLALSAAAYLQIRVTSPTTHMISTAARGVLQSILAVLFLGHERLTRSRVTSIGVILGGTMLYTFVKEMEKRANASKSVLPLHEPFEEQASLMREEEKDGSRKSIEVQPLDEKCP